MANRPTPQPGKIVVRDYPEGTSEATISEWFEPFGPIEEVVSPRAYSDSGKPLDKGRGFTFVKFMNPADVEKAIAGMNEKRIEGHKLSVVQSLYPKRQGRVQGGDDRTQDDSRPRERDYYADCQWGRYDRPAPEGHGYDRYSYDRQRGSRRSPPDYSYGEYLPYHDEYYSGRDSRDHYRQRSPPRRYADPYGGNFNQPRSPYRHPAEADSYYSDYERPYDQYDRPSRRDPPLEAHGRLPPTSERRYASAVDPVDCYEGSCGTRRRALTTATESKPSTQSSSSGTQPMTYPMPSSYRL